MFPIEYAKRNLTVMWVANFFIAGSLTMILPFLSLYIETFGNYSEEYVQRWSGLVFGITFLSAFIFSPIWGRIGDRYGRKKVLVVLAFGLSFSVFLMGFVQSTYSLLALRFFMGLFAGFISMSQALIAAQTLKKEAGKILGTLQTGNVSGGLIGPLIGGTLADAVGFQYTFILTSIATGLTALLVWLVIKEVRVTEEPMDTKESKKEYTRIEVLGVIFKNPALTMIMFVSLLVQAAHFSIQPLLALYVSEMGVTENLALMSGIAFSATGLGNLLLTRHWGKLGDRIGYLKVLALLLLLSSLIYFPQSLVHSIGMLIALRFGLGMVIGGIIPCRSAYIRQVAPEKIQGEIMGYNTSFRFLGNVIGPVMGGLISASFGISSVFYVTSFLFLLCVVLLWTFMPKEAKSISMQ